MADANVSELNKKTAEARKWDKWYLGQLRKYHYECGCCTSRKMTEDEKARYSK